MNDRQQASRHRIALAEHIQRTVGLNESPEITEGALLTMWCVVAEYTLVSGRRAFAMTAGDTDPGNSLPPWRAEGLLHHALAEVTPVGYLPRPPA